MIDQATQQKIKDTADIFEVVSDYVHLIRSGRGYKGLCPFHNERTPSFSVNKARNFCYCFSCKKGGSPVNFIMEKEGLSYYEALRHLANKYGIKIEETEITDEQRLAMEHKESLYVANEWAMQLFENTLHDTAEGRDIGLQYLYSRGVTPEAIKAFHLGFATGKKYSFTNEATKKGFKIEVLKELGLIAVNRDGNDYEAYRGRVIFPIISSSQKVLGFGGRTLVQNPNGAKYVNPPESAVYKKRKEVYGLNLARKEIVANDRCILVEGYLDVIGLWQAGVKNVVASCGTALTNEQVVLISRFTKNVTVLYDGDYAGIKASDSAMDLLHDYGMNVNVLLLPDGDDPDSFSRKHSSEEVRQYIESNSSDAIMHKARTLLERSGNDPQKRVLAIQSLVSSIAHIDDKMKREIYIQECSHIMQVSVESIVSALNDALPEVIRKRKTERELNRLNRDLDTGRITPQPSISSATTNSPVGTTENRESVRNQDSSQTGKLIKKSDNSNPLRPLEWKVIQYCLRYGFIDFCQAMDGEDSEVPKYLTVVEFVNEELRNDGLSFSVDEFANIFNLLVDLLPSFRNDLDNFKKGLEDEIEEKRKDGIDAIASKNLSIAEIRREETKLNEEIENWVGTQTKEFSLSYPSKMLASHENDIVRQLTNEAILEPHQLSHIYSRERPVESEEEKLYNLLPFAITVWKNGILDQKYRDLYKQLQEIAGKGQIEEERKLQAQLFELMRFRSEVAKNIGDRIICPVPSHH